MQVDDEGDFYLSTREEITGYITAIAQNYDEPVAGEPEWDGKIMSFLAGRTTTFGTEGAVKPEDLEDIYDELQTQSFVVQRTIDQVVGPDEIYLEEAEVEGVFDDYLEAQGREREFGPLIITQENQDEVEEEPLEQGSTPPEIVEPEGIETENSSRRRESERGDDEEFEVEIDEEQGEEEIEYDREE
jgi:hypothetical protein